MKIVIFFRKHNDLDHGLPIVDHLVRNKKQYVEVYGVREDYKSCDKHLNYLKNKLSLKVNSFEHVYNSKMDSMIISAITRIKLLSELLPKNIIGTIISIFKHNIVRLLEYMASGPVKRFVSTLESDSVVLVDYGTEPLYPFRYILKHCKQKNIRIIAYQHGYSVFTNRDPIKIKKSFLPKKLHSILFAKPPRKYYDKYLVGPYQKDNFFKGTTYKDFKQLSIVEEIGTPRFCTEWEDIFINNDKDICASKHNKISNSEDSINVVFFLSSSKFNLDQGLLYETIDELRNLKKVNLLIKPHPCSGVPSLIKDNIFNDNISNLSSSELIKWADLGIIFGSSMGFQMLEERVGLIFPTYLDKNSTIYEENNVAIVVDSLKEMIDFMVEYPSKNNMPNELTISNFRNKYIYNNMTYNEIMDAYCYFV